MKVVVDANVIFAAIIGRKFTLNLICSKDFEFYAPEFIFIELEAYRDILKEKGKIDDLKFDAIVAELCRNIKLVSYLEFCHFLSNAREICPDKDDIMYFALAMELNCPLWSNDRKLKQQNMVKIYSTDEMAAILSLKK